MQEKHIPLLHVELFSCDDLPGFIRKTAEKSQNLPEKDKTLLFVDKGALLYQSPVELKIVNGEKVQEQEKGNTKNAPEGINLTPCIGTAQLSSVFPLSGLTSQTVGKDKTQQTWWQVTVISHGQQEITGWVSETDSAVKRCSPWEWRGFDTLKEHANNNQIFDRMTRNLAIELNQGDYSQTMTAVHKVLLQLEKEKIDFGKESSEDPTASTTKNPQKAPSKDLPPLTKANLKQALATKPLASTLSRQLIHYESEWYADDNLTKWKALDKFLDFEHLLKHYEQKTASGLSIDVVQKVFGFSSHRSARYVQALNQFFEQLAQRPMFIHKDQPDPWHEQYHKNIQHLKVAKEQWEKEKGIIKTHLWWTPELAEKLNLHPTGKAWFMHPLGVMGNFNRKGKSLLSVDRGQITFDAEGNDNQNSKFFSRVIHWPEGASGITIGRGYDMKLRSKDEIYRDMLSVGILDQQAQLLAEGAGLTHSAAKQFMLNNKNKIGEISHNQQIKLFELIYPYYLKDTERLYNKHTKGEEKRAEWDNLSLVIQDILVDIRYQGSWSQKIAKTAMYNDVKQMIKYIKESEELSKYEKGRNRVGYLQKSLSN